jgi:hypothetical protein
VVFTSGYSPESTGNALQPGDHFLQKPASVAQLVETVRRCLDA